jgi:hydroxypyruvate reductase
VLAQRRLLLDAYAAALAAVDARRCTAAALAAEAPGAVLAVVAGKAAEGMLRALREASQLQVERVVVAAVGARPADLARDARIEWRRGGHPLPDTGSVAAGEAVARLIDGASPTARVIVLLSGGASALLELPRVGVTLEGLIALNARLLASGAPIAALNHERAAVSQLKAGGLARRLGGRSATVYYLSDVTGLDGDADAAVVGSGPCHDGGPTIPHRRIADNGMARDALRSWAAARGVACVDHGLLAGDARTAGERIARELREAPAGVHVWGGECTVRLPQDHGRGGRCQQLALAAAGVLDGGDCALLAVGTDGRDGPGSAAGALVDGASATRVADAGFALDDALQRCDAGSALAAAGDLVDTGPTGTNVADLVIAHRAEPRA